MKVLDKQDAARFFVCFFPLLDYVNQTYDIYPEIERVGPTSGLALPQFHVLAQALWDDVQLIDDYLADCPPSADAETRALIAGWKHAVRGRFILERHLKDGSILIEMDSQSVYLVKGLTNTWEDLMPGWPLPIALEATLLPFRDVIITDGLVQPFDVNFGKGYKEGFKEIYMAAKNNSSIVRSLA